MSGRNRLVLTDDSYPPRLKEIPDPPKQLYVRGQSLDLSAPMVGIVGARRCTEYGESAGYKLGKELAALGITVVSGMAYGVDSYAHQGALDNGGLTIAVLGCGVDVCYPKRHRQLMDDIIERGCVVSEYPDGTQPVAHHFPQRNRIISGLCLGLVVVEASAKSGALITARCALAHRRKLMAVPGSIFNEHSVGTNELIRNGAIPVTNGQDIQEALTSAYGTRSNALPTIDRPILSAASIDKIVSNTKAAPKQAPAPSFSSPTEAQLYACISYEAKTADELAYLSGLHIKDVLGALSMLEINDHIRRTQGQRFVRTV